MSSTLIQQSTRSLSFVVVGLGGFAGVICDKLQAESARGRVRLHGVFDPDPHIHPERVLRLQQGGVQLFRSYEQLLAEAVDAVWLPVPIDLHRSFAEAAMAAGKAVLLEKPATGCIQDLDALIQVRDSCRVPVCVAFQHVYQPMLRLAKKVVHSGNIGRIISTTVVGCWPRSRGYYSRNNWAGRIRRDGAWILDSPASNALAHYQHLALFLLGRTGNQNAQPVSVEAELYCANEIENYDTCALRIRTNCGQEILTLFSHAGETEIAPQVTITGTRGRVTYIEGMGLEVERGRVLRRIPAEQCDYAQLPAQFSRYIAGDDSASVGTLEMARAHLTVVNGASQVAPIVRIPAGELETVNGRDGAPLIAIRGIEETLNYCAKNRCLIGESGRHAWGTVARTCDLQGYRRFTGPASFA